MTAALITDIILKVAGIFNYLVVLLMLLGTVIFLWGVVSYMIAAGDEEKTREAKKYMLWGVIALFFMVAVWGLVQVLINTFGVAILGTPIGPGTP